MSTQTKNPTLSSILNQKNTLKNELNETQNQQIIQLDTLSQKHPPLIRKNYDYTLRVKQYNDDEVSPSMTDQSQKDECDANLIVKRFNATGLESLLQKKPMAQFGDFTQIPNFHDAMNQMAAAQTFFAELPATVREFFENDSKKFVKFADDPKNAAKLIELGLATARPEPSVEQTTPPEGVPTTPPKTAQPRPVKTEKQD